MKKSLLATTSIVSTLRQLFEEADTTHNSFRFHLTKAKDVAFDCGLTLLKAKRLSEECGKEFNSALEEHIPHFPRTTAWRYMRFARDMIKLAQIDRPALKDSQAPEVARTMVMRSAHGFLELMREAAHILRPSTGGGRRLGQSEILARKFDTDYQLELHFEEFDGWLAKVPNAKANPFFKLPAPRLQETCTRLETALRLAREALANSEPIPL